MAFIAVGWGPACPATGDYYDDDGDDEFQESHQHSETEFSLVSESSVSSARYLEVSRCRCKVVVTP